MDQFQEYSHYSSEDFVEDSSFWGWVLEETNANRDFWKKFVEANPGMAGAIAQAREKVLELNTQQVQLPQDRVASLWAKINQSASTELPLDSEQAQTRAML